MAHFGRSLSPPSTAMIGRPEGNVEKKHHLKLIGGDVNEQAVFAEDERGDDCILTCTYRGKTISAEAPDFFEALCGIRLQLEADGLIPFCYGASLNVYPSPMARGMGGGLKAYRLTRGAPARTADLVAIFSEGSDVVPASVEAQANFYDDWLGSLAS